MSEIIGSVDTTPVNPAVIQLSSVERTINIQDMNYQFHYTRLKKPDAVDDKVFLLNYKENQQPSWSTSKNLLSDEFTVAKTEMIIQQIKDNLSGNVIKQRHFRTGTSVKVMFVLSGYDVDIPDDPDMNKILFKLITNLDSGTDVITSNKLSFNVINGFSGNHALQLNFGILKVMNNANNTTNPEIPINNIFILDRHTIRLIHNASLNVNVSNVTDVQRSIITIIDQYRNVEFPGNYMADMVRLFPKKFMKRVSDMWESLPTEIRNYYYLTYVLSACLEDERRVDLEIRLRSYVSESLRREIIRLEQAETDLGA